MEMERWRWEGGDGKVEAGRRRWEDGDGKTEMGRWDGKMGWEDGDGKMGCARRPRVNASGGMLCGMGSARGASA
ncbi:hypothetical protein [Aureliella helgolandensis]|uniref:hypothetical protein n=1 Tax=Aureliella helgolandensis TaxID=2527968 RepID=UPI00119E3C04|nr:hypothetical protein [Aureliella helgolandensis]